MQHTIYWIEGDGIGADIWKAAKPVIDAAVECAYHRQEELIWKELLAGEKAYKETGQYLPEQTLEALKSARVAIKGPLATPVGTGIRSLTVALRQTFDLYACIRPVKWYEGIIAAVRHPEKVNMTIFRENTEDVYSGIEFASNTDEAKKLINFLNQNFNKNLKSECAIGIKPMTEYGCKRLVRRAVQYAVKNNLPSVTLVHKGNIMKFTEGAFQKWGYEVAKEEFADCTITEKEVREGADPQNKIIIKDRIADAMFQEALIRPEEYSVIATTNLNGDYLSDALAAQVGGLGMAPGVNMSDSLAIFEATHGTAPTVAGKDVANPCSLLLSSAMLLEHIGLDRAGTAIQKAIQNCIDKKTVTQDLAKEIENAETVSCSSFGKLLTAEIRQMPF